MIFMSQSGLTDANREADWDGWYVKHLEIMATVPGISSAQRFKTADARHPPSLAMYSVASPSVFQDPYYLSVRGMGEWLPLIDTRYYRRNLFEGLAYAPEVAAGHVLLVADRRERDRAPAETEWTWLDCVGIDRSTPWRGIAIIDEVQARDMDTSDDIAVYRPVTPRYAARAEQR